MQSTLVFFHIDTKYRLLHFLCHDLFHHLNILELTSHSSPVDIDMFQDTLFFIISTLIKLPSALYGKIICLSVF